MARLRHRGVTQIDAREAENVAPGARRHRSARRVALAIGAGRLAIGCAALADPVASIRLLGLDSATATRAAWLARMCAARDAALGAGTINSVASRRGQTSWLLAGALADAGDAAAFALAVRSGRLPRTRGYLAAASGVAGAVAGLGSAAGLLRR
ncbi:MAG TPA: hypothetical protein VF869_07610 [Jatrophihabitantaceae bacterium]